MAFKSSPDTSNTSIDYDESDSDKSTDEHRPPIQGKTQKVAKKWKLFRKKCSKQKDYRITAQMNTGGMASINSRTPSVSRMCQRYRDQQSMSLIRYACPAIPRTIPAYYPHYTCSQAFCCPPPGLAYPVPSHLYNAPIPVYSSIPCLTTPVYPYTSAFIPIAPPPPIIAEAVLPTVSPVDMQTVYSPTFESLNTQVVPSPRDYTASWQPEELTPPSSQESQIEEVINYSTNSLESYLSLPKNLFPTARMIKVDPNPIINEFCRQRDIQDHSPWLLDLEFGVPKTPVVRPIASYDVYYNSIRCKNTPEAIHPGFENCSQEFKKTFLFYYDCIVSTWYKGYMETTCDHSVANFQSWLQRPMHNFGLCWP